MLRDFSANFKEDWPLTAGGCGVSNDELRHSHLHLERVAG